VLKLSSSKLPRIFRPVGHKYEGRITSRAPKKQCIAKNSRQSGKIFGQIDREQRDLQNCVKNVVVARVKIIKLKLTWDYPPGQAENVKPELAAELQKSIHHEK